MSPSGAGGEREESVDDPNDVSDHEVLLSCGVTTDPSLWDLPPEESSQLTDSVSEDETAPPPPRKAPASPSGSVSDRDMSEEAEDAQNAASEDEELKERRETEEEKEEDEEEEERGTPEGETSAAQEPMDRRQWEELVGAVVAADPSLSRVMFPLANRKTALMLMEQLLSEDTLLMEEHYKKKQELLGAADRSVSVLLLPFVGPQ